MFGESNVIGALHHTSEGALVVIVVIPFGAPYYDLVSYVDGVSVLIIGLAGFEEKHLDRIYYISLGLLQGNGDS